MKKRNDLLNKNTQPMRTHKVFNNWNIVTKGWYSALESKELKKLEARTVSLNGHKIVLYRGDSGEVYCLDAFCPHMGVDLGIGKVIGEELRCFFHHWKFDKNAKCTHIPAGEEPPKNLKLNPYKVEERYGLIWVWPENETSERVLEVPELSGISDDELVWRHDDIFYRTCHYHITMINGIDPQHLKTVHGIHIDMNIDIDETKKNHIEIVLKGKFPDTTFKERIGRKIFGEEYSYAMKYADGCLASLTMLKGAKLFNRFKIPELHMFFSYAMVDEGKVSVRPIYINKKSKGILGPIFNFIKLTMTKMFFMMLQGEDGEVYDNIRFNTEAFLKMDKPVVKYIGYINRLEPSLWSQADLKEN